MKAFHGSTIMRNQNLIQADILYADGRSEIIPCDSFCESGDVWKFYRKHRVVRKIPAGALRQPPDGLPADSPKTEQHRRAS
jgi:hypothetical protein